MEKTIPKDWQEYLRQNMIKNIKTDIKQKNLNCKKIASKLKRHLFKIISMSLIVVIIMILILSFLGQYIHDNYFLYNDYHDYVNIINNINIFLLVVLTIIILYIIILPFLSFESDIHSGKYFKEVLKNFKTIKFKVK